MADLSRRWLLKAIPVLGVGTALPATAQGETIDRKIVDLIGELERVDGWEMHATVCAKLWVAEELRGIAGMEPSPFRNEIGDHHATGVVLVICRFWLSNQILQQINALGHACQLW